MTGHYAMFSFPWVKMPLTSNQRMHWAQKAKVTAMVRRAGAIAFNGVPPLGRVEVTLTWVVRTKHRRDADNAVPTLKALCDGLVDAGIVPDDTPEYMLKHMPVIRYEPVEEPCIVLELREITP